MELVKRLLSLFSIKGRLKLLGLLGMMCFGALLELVGLGLVMPVVALLAEPSLMEQNRFLKAIHGLAGGLSDARFLILLCLALTGIYIVKNGYQLLLVRLQARFIYGQAAQLGSRLFESYLKAPYAYHLKKNSSNIVNNINIVGVLCNSVLMNALSFCAEAIVVLAIFGSMLLLAPLLTLGLVAFSVGLTAALFLLLRGRNAKIGVELKDANKALTRECMQSMECVKECKISNAEDVMAGRSAACQKRLRLAEGRSFVYGQVPRFAIESLVVAGGMGALATLILFDVAAGSIILRLSFIAIALMRLMPSLSRMNYQITNIRHYLPYFNEIFTDLETLKPEEPSKLPPLKFERTIVLDKLSFRYEGAAKEAVSGFSLEIEKNQSIALVGQTGCGKTTLLDLILGLLKPCSGRILVDGRDIEENLPSWQRRIGYVPQAIHLFDASIKENVAFAVPEERIDEAKVRRCLEVAQLKDFIDGLPEGLETEIGERGVRLSGGQRQRIGIARALYGDPEVLALDEATSALDNETEKAFTDALKNLKGKLTIIMIAHRLSTVENCDKTIKL